MVLDQRWHPLIESGSFHSVEEYVLYLIHRQAYEHAAQMARGRDVLDWGCNQGYGMEILCGQANHVSGLDLAPHAVQAARERLPELASDIRLYGGTAVPFPACTFDMVTSFQVIEHVADCETYLSHIRHVLRPGGCAVFTTPNARLRLDPGMKPWNEFHVREFTAPELHESLVRCFQHVEILALRGTSEIESVEKARCERERISAKRNRGIKALRRLGSTFLRRAKIRTVRKQASLSSEMLSRYSVSDLRYSRSDLEAGLDFLAIAWK